MGTANDNQQQQRHHHHHHRRSQNQPRQQQRPVAGETKNLPASGDQAVSKSGAIVGKGRTKPTKGDESDDWQYPFQQQKQQPREEPVWGAKERTNERDWGGFKVSCL
uniref:Uncharacterized protein n=1 Tax=Anopheles maculatus TaxID=74869 RepID=A0A182SV39_9DIPT